MKLKLYIALLFFGAVVFAQQKPLSTSINVRQNKIGAEFKLSLKAIADTSARVVFPTLKNLGALEVIQSYPVDTVWKDSKYELVKTYGLTQFDSGTYALPAVKILINNKPFYSDSLRVQVANVVVDTLKQKMFDIKPIAQGTKSNRWIWNIVLVLLILAAAGFGFYWWRKRKKQVVETIEEAKSPIEKATNMLNVLEKKQLWQKGEVKSYYSELTAIARNYIEEAIAIPAMESTTAELIAALQHASKQKKMELTAETIENLERVLKQADLVKFAKSKPLDFEITEDRKKIEKAIVTLDSAIPTIEENEEESALNELQRQQQLQLQLAKARKRRNQLIAASVVGVLLLVFGYFTLTKGFTYVKDTLIRKETKLLLEGEWVQSEYGNPAVRLETPQVLVRTDLSKKLPKEGMALIKDMQSFVEGQWSDAFYVMVNTLHYKNQGEVDLDKSINVTIDLLENMGAQNMLVKQEEFQTKQGVSGRKGYGTFVLLNTLTKSSTTYYYEVLLFGQDGGLQQLVLVHEEGDAYANAIAERILNSVELKQATP
ncbi:MAG: hypothetical protein NTX74_00840 [Flavobacterium sp.]|nr:hypothetical protein [Flavobacterium sp.]